MRVLKTFLIFVVCTAPAWAQNAIVPGAPWLDDRGIPIQAHGGGVVKEGDVYYWFGEDYYQRQPGMRYVGCYASKDLVHWFFRNRVLQMSAPEGLDQGWILERPKVYPNALTHQYVMYMHIDSGDYKAARVGIAVSDRIDGNYRFVKSFRPLGNESRDIGQFIDDDGTAYLISEDRPNGFHIYRLSPDYLNIAQDVCLIREHMEGGALVHDGGLYYIICSHLSGWNPNPNVYATAPRLEGPWSAFKGIAPWKTNTYGSQSTFLLKVVGSETTSVIFMADKWEPEKLWDSRYLWMPLQIGGGNASLPPPAPWTIDVATGEAQVAGSAMPGASPANPFKDGHW